MVEQNSLKFEVIEKMNNLANLVQYKSKYGDICLEIDNYYNEITQKEKEQKASLSSKSLLKPKVKSFKIP